jgi:hypothetical protein
MLKKSKLSTYIPKKLIKLTNFQNQGNPISNSQQTSVDEQSRMMRPVSYYKLCVEIEIMEHLLCECSRYSLLI